MEKVCKTENCDDKFDHLEKIFDEKLSNTNEKVKVIFKRMDNFESIFKNINDILIRMESVTKQQSKWIDKKDERDEKRDQLLLEISQNLRSINDKQESHDGKLGDLDKKIDNTIIEHKKSQEKPDAFKEFVYRWGTKAIEWGIMGGIIYFILHNYVK